MGDGGLLRGEFEINGRVVQARCSEDLLIAQFLANNIQVTWGVNSQSDSVRSNPNDGDLDLVADENPLT